MTDDKQSTERLRIVIGDRLPIVLVCLVLGLASAGLEAYCGDTKAATISLALEAAIVVPNTPFVQILPSPSAAGCALR